MGFTLIHRFRNKIKVDKSSHITLGKKFKMSGCQVVIKGQNNTLNIADNVRLSNVFIQIIGNNCNINIGSGSMIGRESYISAREENISLIIGERTALSRNVKVMTSDGHPIFKNKLRINPAKNIIIGDDIWIADNVTVLKGVAIGSGSVIGINSMVVKDIPTAVVAVGNPCCVVKENITWAD